MTKLDEENRHSDIINVYEIYMKNMEPKTSQNETESSIVLNEQIDIYSRSLYSLVNYLSCSYHTFF